MLRADCRSLVVPVRAMSRHSTDSESPQSGLQLQHLNYVPRARNGPDSSLLRALAPKSCSSSRHATDSEFRFLGRPIRLYVFEQSRFQLLYAALGVYLFLIHLASPLFRCQPSVMSVNKMLTLQALEGQE